MRVAVIGAGRMGRCHMQAICSLDLELVGICDQNLETVILAGEESNISLDRQFASGRMKPEVI